MEDLNGKLAELLGDPASMERIKKMAEGLLGSGSESVPETEPDGMPDAQTLMRAVSLLKNAGQNDSRIQLLQALKPNLSDTRRDRVDTAIKLMRLMEIAPLIKDTGLF